MKLIKSIIILIYVFISFSQLYASVPDNILENKKSIVTIYINESNKNISSGSGFIIEPEGIIVTNYHVVSKTIDKNYTINAKTENGLFLINGKIEKYDITNDIALIKFDASNLNKIKINYNYEPKQGESIFVIGSPMGLEYTVSEGIISSIRISNTNTNLIQITAPVSPGSSGSPVFNLNGEVIGIATFKIEGGQNLNFAIPIKYIPKMEFIQKNINENNTINPFNKLIDLISNIKETEIIEKAKKIDQYEQSIYQLELDDFEKNLTSLTSEISMKLISILRNNEINETRETKIINQTIELLNTLIKKQPNNLENYLSLINIYYFLEGSKSNKLDKLFEKALSIRTLNFESNHYKLLIGSKKNMEIKPINNLKPISSNEVYLLFSNLDIYHKYISKNFNNCTKLIEKLIEEIKLNKNNSNIIKYFDFIKASQFIYLDLNSDPLIKGKFSKLIIDYYKELIKLYPDNIIIKVQYALWSYHSTELSINEKVDIIFNILDIIESDNNYKLNYKYVKDLFDCITEIYDNEAYTLKYINNKIEKKLKNEQFLIVKMIILLRFFNLFPNHFEYFYTSIVEELILLNKPELAEKILNVVSKTIFYDPVKFKQKCLHYTRGLLYFKLNKIDLATSEYKNIVELENTNKKFTTINNYLSNKLFQLIYK